MSNILIIKHGSLGDLIQANGAIKDIKQSFPDDKILLLTTPPYANFMSYCPYINGVLIDKRLPRWNIFYLLKLKKIFQRFTFKKVFDLQNSSRTKFYRKFFFRNIDCSSTESSLEDNQKKSDFDKEPVLKRMRIQLEKSGIDTTFTESPDLSWAVKSVKSLMNQYIEGDYISIFPFCSSRHKNKVWPYFKELIKEIKNIYGKKYNVVMAPGPNEINLARKLDANVILNNDKALDIMQLVGFIEGSSYVISNDTGPAHISAHLNKKGLVLFGSHTSAKKVSIGGKNFKSIEVNRLEDLDVKTVIEKIKVDLN